MGFAIGFALSHCITSPVGILYEPLNNKRLRNITVRLYRIARRIIPPWVRLNNLASAWVRGQLPVQGGENLYVLFYFI